MLCINYKEFAFKTFDYDHNGVIDFSEFLSVLSVTTQGDVKEKLKMAFNL